MTKRSAKVLAVVAASLPMVGHAATYTWTGLNNTTTDWADTTKWVDGLGSPGAPVAGDLAQLNVSITSWTTLDIKGGASVGSVYAKPQWDQMYRIKSSWTGQRTFAFNNNGADSVVTLTSATSSATYTGNLTIGQDDKAINISLANNLVVNNDSTRLANGRLSFGALSTITGGSTTARRTITTQALASGKITTAVGGAATFVGDWVVDGAKATLDMNANSFGDASNSVTLRNGGVLDLNASAFNTFTWTRSLSGKGTVLAYAAGNNDFAVGSGGTINLAGSDQLAVTGDLVLQPGSVLNVTGPIVDGQMLFTTTGLVSGQFGTVNLPAGFGLNYGTNSISLVVPEPASLALIGLSTGVLLARRRKG